MTTSEPRIHADFGRPVALPAEAQAWVPSPLPGVERRMLDRVGGEVARATSIVRYAPGSRFDAHVHELGEEFLVLEGVFSDDAGDYAAGTYVRNPPGSRHAPWSEAGCTIFVKLRQFDRTDLERKVVSTRGAPFEDAAGGLRVLPLHAHGRERVALWRVPGGRALPVTGEEGGAELLVLEGRLDGAGVRGGPGSWFRQPPGRAAAWVAGPEGALAWSKTGHLLDLPRPGAGAA